MLFNSRTMNIEQLRQTEVIGRTYLSELKTRAKKQRQAAMSVEAFLPAAVSAPLFQKAMTLEGAIYILEADIMNLSKEIERLTALQPQQLQQR